tara:strand:- start:11 stop:316 length:306 start_codon:yes stop_codon:yes gene_type:complete
MRVKKTSKYSYLSFIDRFRQDIEETEPISRIEQTRNNTNDENREQNKRFNSDDMLLNMSASKKKEYDSARQKFTLEQEVDKKILLDEKKSEKIGSNIDFII